MRGLTFNTLEELQRLILEFSRATEYEIIIRDRRHNLQSVTLTAAEIRKPVLEAMEKTMRLMNS
jgi:hypothetical protein